MGGIKFFDCSFFLVLGRGDDGKEVKWCVYNALIPTFSVFFLGTFAVVSLGSERVYSPLCKGSSHSITRLTWQVPSIWPVEILVQPHKKWLFVNRWMAELESHSSLSSPSLHTPTRPQRLKYTTLSVTFPYVLCDANRRILYESAMLIKLHGVDAIESREKEMREWQKVDLELGATLAGCEFGVIGCLVTLGAQLLLLLENPVLVLARLSLAGANARIGSPNNPCNTKEKGISLNHLIPS